MALRHVFGLSLCLTGAIFSGSAGAQSKSEPRYTLDEAGTRVIALSNLPGGEDCASATSTGRVVKRHFEKGALRAITFKDVKFGESYINLPYPNQIRNAQIRAKVEEGFASLLVEGQELVLGVKGCGAAGRIEKLASVALRDPKKAAIAASPDSGTTPPDAATGQPVTAASAKPSKWRPRQLSKVQHSIAIASNDLAFSFSLSCMKGSNGRVSYSTFFAIPRDWSPIDFTSAISLDGTATNWELGGADDGFVLSDTIEENMVTLSAAARTALAKGGRLAIAGRTDRGRPRNAAFDIAGGEAPFASFTTKCETLPRP